MKYFLTAATFVAAAFATPAIAADVGVSISVGQPGFYGRIDIGDFAQPRVIYRQPVVIGHVPANRPPVYLHVPPGHIKHWRKHCHEYNACGERVYFVDQNWYNDEYVPHYQQQHRERRDEGRDERGYDDRGKQENEHRGRGHER